MLGSVRTRVGFFAVPCYNCGNPETAVTFFRLAFFAVRFFAAAALFVAAGAGAREGDDKQGAFEIEVGGMLIDLDETAAPTMAVANSLFAAPLSLSAGTAVGPVFTASVTLNLFAEYRAPTMFAAADNLNFVRNGNTLQVADGSRLTIVRDGARITVTTLVQMNTVALHNINNNAAVATVAAGESLQLFDREHPTVGIVETPLNNLPADINFAGFGANARLAGCAAAGESTSGVGASGRYYLTDDFVDLSLEGGFYATIEKGALRLNCRLENATFGNIANAQTASASSSGEWSADSIFLALRVEDDLGPATAYFRVGWNYWTREYTLPDDFAVNGLNYKADDNNHEYIVPAPTLRWRPGGDGRLLSDPKQDGFDSHFAFGVRLGALSAGWTRNKQDDFRVDAFHFSYVQEF